MNLKNTIKSMKRSLAILLSSTFIYSSSVCASDTDSSVETMQAKIMNYEGRKDLLNDSDYDFSNLSGWFKESDETEQELVRTKIILDLLWDYPEKEKKMENVPLSELFLSDLEEELNDDHYHLKINSYEYLFGCHDEDHYERNYYYAEDFEEDIGSMIANSIANSIVKKYKWIRDFDKRIREVKDMTYIKGEYEGIKFKVGFSLDDYYYPMVELCLKEVPLLDKIEYFRSINQSEIKIKLSQKDNIETALYLERDFKEEEEEGVKDIEYGLLMGMSF
jgi:hypothetical protein